MRRFALFMIGFALAVPVTGIVLRGQLAARNRPLMGLLGIRIPEASKQRETSVVVPHLAALGQKTKDDFDKPFIELLIAHEQEALDAANQTDGIGHSQLGEFASQLRYSHTLTIYKLKDWQALWGYTLTTDSPSGIKHCDSLYSC